MADLSTREIAELIGGVPDTEPHALMCRVAAERLLQQERELQGIKRTLWATVRAAGGKVEVGDDLLVDAPRGFLHTHHDPSIPAYVIHANFDA